MFRIKSENNVANEIASTIDVEVIERSHRGQSQRSAMNYLQTWSKVFKTAVLAYEVKLNRIHNKYPDFLLLIRNFKIRIEVKDKECEQTIAKEINSLDKYDDNEFWYVICGNSDILKIQRYLTKKGKNIKLIMFADLKTELKKFLK